MTYYISTLSETRVHIAVTNMMSLNYNSEHYILTYFIYVKVQETFN